MAVCSSVVRYKTVGQCASGLLLAVLVLPGVLPTLLRTQTLRRSEGAGGGALGSCLLAVVLFALGARVFLLTALDRVWGPSCCPFKRVVAVGEAPSPWVQCASASADMATLSRGGATTAQGTVGCRATSSA